MAEHETDEAVIESAIEEFVKHLAARRYEEADQAAAIAFGVARLVEAEDPMARSRW